MMGEAEKEKSREWEGSYYYFPLDYWIRGGRRKKNASIHRSIVFSSSLLIAHVGVLIRNYLEYAHNRVKGQERGGAMDVPRKGREILMEFTSKTCFFA
jgi:hypothetical protein